MLHVLTVTHLSIKNVRIVNQFKIFASFNTNIHTYSCVRRFDWPNNLFNIRQGRRNRLLRDENNPIKIRSGDTYGRKTEYVVDMADITPLPRGWYDPVKVGR